MKRSLCILCIAYSNASTKATTSNIQIKSRTKTTAFLSPSNSHGLQSTSSRPSLNLQQPIAHQIADGEPSSRRNLRRRSTVGGIASQLQQTVRQTHQGDEHHDEESCWWRIGGINTLNKQRGGNSRLTRSLKKSNARFTIVGSSSSTRLFSHSHRNASSSSPPSPTTRREQATSSSALRQRRSSNKTNSNNQKLNNRNKVKRPQSTRKEAGGSWYQRDEMLQHAILTKEDEVELSSKLIKARKVRDQMTELLQELEEKRYIKDTYGQLEDDYEENNGDDDMRDMMILGEEETIREFHLEDMEVDDNNNIDDNFMSIYTSQTNSHRNFPPPQSSSSPNDTPWSGAVVTTTDHRISSTLVKDGSKLSIESLTNDLNQLTEHDVKIKLNIQGGKRELRQILYEGVDARETLIRSNLRLVVSIAKKWMGRSAAAGNSEGNRMFALYNGGWDRPSLDEVIQEGVLGLARAADKYDPDRGLRFSTYSTHWITSYVRQSFQNAVTGCLKVPSQLHEIKNAYKRIMRRQFELSEPFPSEKEIAVEIGVSPSRLRTALRVTEALLSIDEPISSGGNAAFKGSGAGGDFSGDNGLLISDRLESPDTPPEEHVEISFLRQTLENAMAAELSPHERDVLRLRLGLDDGQTRTVREVVEECGGGISIADVRSAERRAFKKLRSPNALHAHNLLEYMEMSGIEFN